MNALHHNIWKLYVHKSLRWMLLIMLVLIPFFQENGLGLQDILLLQAAFSTSLIIFEVPSGYIADVIGRKVTLIVGSIIGAIAFSLYATAYTFYEFLLVEMLLGIGGSLISGADSALLYDTLLELKKEEQYQKYAGRLSSIANFSEGIAAIIGGELALISLRTPLYIEAIFTIFAVPIAFTLVEPKRHKAENREKNCALRATRPCRNQMAHTLFIFNRAINIQHCVVRTTLFPTRQRAIELLWHWLGHTQLFGRPICIGRLSC